MKSSLLFFFLFWSVGFLPKRSILVAHPGMLGLQAWADGLIVILFEFLDDDTKLAQSCRNWLYVQHWHTVVPELDARDALGADGGMRDCRTCHTTGPLSLCFCRLFSRLAVICTTTATALAGTSARIVLYPHSVPLLCISGFCSRFFWIRSPVRQFDGFRVVAGAASRRALSHSHTRHTSQSR